MAWLGGFQGDSYTRDQFRAWLQKQKKPSFSSFITIHNTGAPYTLASVGGATRTKNLGNYYKNEKKWKGGPHLFVMEDKVYPGTPINMPTVHSPSWNNISLAIEAEGDFDGTHDPKKGKGIVTWDTMAWAVAEIMDWMQWDIDEKHIRFHREDKATTHACPGNLVEKSWFIDKVRAADGQPARPTQEQPLKKVWVNNVPVGDWLNTRRGPGTQYEVNGKLYNGTSLVALDQSGVWTQVRTPGGYIVWVGTKYLTPFPPTTVKDLPKPQATASLHTSKVGLDMIKHFEGLRLEPYDDVGALAIGYGHSNRSQKPPYVTPELRITQAQAEKILADDLIDYENRVKKSIVVPLLWHQFDALVSIAYNWGPGNLDRSELRKLVNAGKHKEAEAMIRTILPPKDKKQYAGILRRRNIEADLYGGKSI